jgi:NAD(P)-dependent dehydrogenase (short-subunit alcohol dehydrogenase family)
LVSPRSAHFIQPYLPPGIDAERVLAAAHQRLATQKGRSQAERLRDVARVIAFLASDEAASCSGAEFVVDNAATAGDRLEGLPGY